MQQASWFPANERLRAEADKAQFSDFGTSCYQCHRGFIDQVARHLYAELGETEEEQRVRVNQLKSSGLYDLWIRGKLLKMDNEELKDLAVHYIAYVLPDRVQTDQDVDNLSAALEMTKRKVLEIMHSCRQCECSEYDKVCHTEVETAINFYSIVANKLGNEIARALKFQKQSTPAEIQEEIRRANFKEALSARQKSDPETSACALM